MRVFIFVADKKITSQGLVQNFFLAMGGGGGEDLEVETMRFVFYFVF